MTIARRTLAAAVALLTTTASSAAHADHASARKAEKLFREGSVALEQKRYQEACEKLDESNKLEPALGTAYNLAVCFELSKRTASARRAYGVAAKMARDLHKDRVSADALARITALEESVATVTIRAPADAVAVKIVVDDAEIADATKPIELDPGSHRVHATADGRAPFDATVELAEGEKKEVPLDLPLSAPPPKPPPPKPPPRPAESGWTTLQIVGVSTAVVGVVGLGAGGFFALQATTLRDESGCRDGRFCPDDPSASRLRDAKSSADLATIFAIAGGTLAIGGAALYLFGGPSDSASANARVGTGPSVRLVPTASPSSAGVGAFGRF